MNQDEMWSAVKSNDEDYDGVFFYAVKTTGIYCRPSCKSKLPNKGNVNYFKTSDEARTDGYRPCKRCRSDLLDYKPMLEIAQNVKKLMDEVFLSEYKLQNEMSKVGVSPHRMNEIFKKHYGVTVSEYVSTLKLAESKRRLADSDEAVIEIAYSVGFSSMSGFYNFFKEKTSVTPVKYRKMNRRIEEK